MTLKFFIRISLFIGLFLCLCGVLKGQFYSGDYRLTSHEGLFNRLSIKHTSGTLNPFEGELMISAYHNSDAKRSDKDPWIFSATTSAPGKSLSLTKRYASEFEALAVYDFDMYVDGAYFQFYMLTYQNEEDQSCILMIEEVYQKSNSAEPPLETFTTMYTKAK